MTQSVKIFLISSLSLYLPLFLYQVFFQHSFDLNHLLNQYLYWDSGWYIRIATQGYPECFNNCHLTYDHLVYAWPPLFGLLIRFVNKIFKNFGITIFLLQNVLVFINVFLFQKVIYKVLPKVSGWPILLIYVLFPMSLFLYSGYSETIYIALTLGFIYLLLIKKYFLASLLASLTPIVRFQGALNFILLNSFYLKDKISWRKIIFYNLIFIAPICLWLFWIYHKTNNLFFIPYVLNSDLAFREWHKYSGNIFTNSFNWVKSLFGLVPAQLDIRLQGLFLILYCFLNIRLIKLYQRSKNINLLIFGIFGLIYSIFPLQTGIESIARYGYAFPLTFLGFYNISKSPKLFYFILFLSISLRLLLSIMFYLHLHVT